MILQKIILENFRQFFGKQELTFATGKERNITLIHAENGFGKTALLNALLWGFFGHDGLTAELPKKENIIHDGLARISKDPTSTQALVTILFQDDEGKYTLTRSLTLAQQKVDPTKTEVELWIQRQDGNTIEMFPREPRLRQQWIESMMPLAITPYLFFDGENMNHLAMEENAAEVADSIRQMLGVSLIQRTIEDLNNGNVRGRLTKELRDNTDEETAGMIDHRIALDQKIASLTDSVEQCRKNQAANAEEIKIVDNKLQANQKARELQNRRARLEAEQTDAQVRQHEVDQRLTQLIAEDGYCLFSDDLARTGRKITTKLRSEGKIPAPINDRFLRELLDRGQCICGAPLKEGDAYYTEVSQLLSRAGDESFNNAVAALENALGVVDGAITRTRQNFTMLAQERTELKTHLRKINEELEAIHDELGARDDDEISKLEQKREDLLLRQRQLVGEEAVLKHQFAETQAELEKTKDRIIAKKQQEEIADRAQRRIKLLDEMVTLLEQVLTSETSDLQQRLRDEINHHFRKIIDRDYWVELTKDFALKLRKNVAYLGEFEEMDVATSKGQRQLTALVFVASLVGLAKRRHEIPTILRGLEGNAYPLVMDSPVSDLSDRFTRGVIRWIPTVAPQVAIFLTCKNYRGPAAEELENAKRVGKQYLLAYHGPSKNEEVDSQIQIDGKTFQQYYYEDTEFTEIQEVEL